MREKYNLKYQEEVWKPILLHPHAMSTTRYDDIARLLRDKQGRLFELGCGAGQLMIALAPQFEHLTGQDLSDTRIDLANRIVEERFPQLRSRLTFLKGSAETRLPFPDESFDVVIACVVLEVVPDIFGTMDELARICRPGGSCVVTVANICYLRHVLSLLRGQIPLTWSTTRDIAHWRKFGWDDGALRYFSKIQLNDLMHNTGFIPQRWTGSGLMAPLRRWYSGFCGDITLLAQRKP